MKRNINRNRKIHPLQTGEDDQEADDNVPNECEKGKRKRTYSIGQNMTEICPGP